MLVSNICTSTQLKSPVFQRWMDEIRHAPMIMHRKLWEWAYIAQALEERGMLAPGKRGLGFAVGREPLTPLFAARGCEIVATDLDECAASAAGWTTTNQHAADLSALNGQGLCPPHEFAERVSFRVVNMNDIPDDLTGFDFIWSSCAIEHLGDIAATHAFMTRMMSCLKPDGVAVHTTEYNLSSESETVESGATVIFRRSDLEAMIASLERDGHAVEPLDLEVGDAPDDQVVLHPPYEGYPCLKIWLEGHAATSIGLIARAGNSPRADAKKATRHPEVHSHSVVADRSALKPWLTPPDVAPVASSSARNHADVEDVRLAYRLVLGREADPGGLAHFAALAAAKGLSAADIALMLSNSEEFAARSGRLGAPVEVRLDGYSMFARPSDRDIGHAIAKGGAYEPHVTAAVRRELREGSVFLDVGANIGYFSMLAAHLVGSSGKVISVEPLDKNLQLIYAGILRNGFDTIEVFPFGASEGNGIVAMVTDPGTSNALIQSAPSDRATSFFIPTRTLDSITAHQDRIDLMKMDIEGHEIFAWRGAQSMLARCRPKILTEFHPKAMRENAGIAYQEYLAIMFAYAREVMVVVSPDELVPCLDEAQVMAQWELADRIHGGTGSSHLDLFLLPRD